MTFDLTSGVSSAPFVMRPASASTHKRTLLYAAVVSLAHGFAPYALLQVCVRLSHTTNEFCRPSVKRARPWSEDSTSICAPSTRCRQHCGGTPPSGAGAMRASQSTRPQRLLRGARHGFAADCAPRGREPTSCLDLRLAGEFRDKVPSQLHMIICNVCVGSPTFASACPCARSRYKPLPELPGNIAVVTVCRRKRFCITCRRQC